MIPDHTKFICDTFFRQIKKSYWVHEVNTVNDIYHIINKSSIGNEGLRYNNKLGWKWYNFQDFFSKNFVNLPHLTDYYHFRFSNLSQDLEKVYCSKISGDTEICYNLLYNNNFNIYKELNILDIVPLSDERKKYLYTKIRKYVNNEFKDTYFL